MTQLCMWIAFTLACSFILVVTDITRDREDVG